ncbi:primosomal protein N' (replication factor Y) [Elusimicrobium posterum]|uniref:replication restart helicase PriA n=1 Tax=Elusimicrobium posterum TaxID=3116653 RepID=UPI003C70C66D
MYAKVVFDIALDREFDYIIPQELQAQAVPMLRVRAPFGPRAAVGIITEITTETDSKFKLKTITEIFDSAPAFSSELLTLAKFMKHNWGGTLGQILFSLIPFFTKAPLHSDALPLITLNTLSPAQKQAKEDIEKAQAPVLLFGEGKSGKKEILINMALQAYLTGQALLLVPDIMSAEVFAKQIEKQINTKVFIWHSKILLSEKKRIFATMLSGQPAIVVGTRSAALLPMANPKLIAVTNEEDSDYKQEENRPYYHVRDIALFRAQALNCKTVFCSATPSLEMLELIKEGKVTQVSLAQRMDLPNPFPRINTAGKKGKDSFLFSDEAVDEIKKAVQNNETVLLISNSRGGSPTYSCLNCSVMARCKKCNGLLVFTDEAAQHLQCVKCGCEASLEQKCPKCENLIFRTKIFGTQKVNAEVKKLFPAANIVRMDKPLTAPLNTLMSADKANVIIGTMAALKTLITRNKTMDFICFIDADMELNSPDFRASEHLTQTLFAAKSMLLNSKTGRMLVQADKADTTLFTSVIHGDYNAFAQEELEFRETFSFPPYTKLLKITISSKKTEDVLKKAEALRAPLAELGEVLGPIPAGKKSDTTKKQYLLVKNADFQKVEALFAKQKADKLVKIKLTADPYSFF